MRISYSWFHTDNRKGYLYGRRTDASTRGASVVSESTDNSERISLVPRIRITLRISIRRTKHGRVDPVAFFRPCFRPWSVNRASSTRPLEGRIKARHCLGSLLLTWFLRSYAHRRMVFRDAKSCKQNKLRIHFRIKTSAGVAVAHWLNQWNDAKMGG